MTSVSAAQLAASLLRAGSVVSDYQVHELQQRETEMQCSCGGKLVEVRRVLLPKPPRAHRKKRINKKWRKRWEQENRHRILASTMIGLTQRPSYRCSKCGRNEGFYSAVGRNLIQVEPLPEGTFPVYDKESP
jgi:hypothetical protein